MVSQGKGCLLYVEDEPLLPETTKCKKMYLRCHKNYTPKVWFCDQPYGVNKIKTTVKELCKEGGIDGKFSNHSLRVTCASRMYENDVPEQIIKEVTGHHSDCVRVYKRTSDKMREHASLMVSKGESEPKKAKADLAEAKTEEHDKGTLSVKQMIENLNKTKAGIRCKKFMQACSHLSLKRLRSKGKVTIDLNANIKK